MTDQTIHLEDWEKISLSDNEKITLADSEKVSLNDSEKISLNDLERLVQSDIQLDQVKDKKASKPALGLFGGMFDLNGDGVIDKEEQKLEKEFLENLKNNEN